MACQDLVRGPVQQGPPKQGSLPSSSLAREKNWAGCLSCQAGWFPKGRAGMVTTLGLACRCVCGKTCSTGGILALTKNSSRAPHSY